MGKLYTILKEVSNAMKAVDPRIKVRPKLLDLLLVASSSSPPFPLLSYFPFFTFPFYIILYVYYFILYLNSSCRLWPPRCQLCSALAPTIFSKTKSILC